PELLVCSGFFIVYLLEEVVHLCVTHSHKHKVQKEHKNGINPRKRRFKMRRECETAKVREAILPKAKVGPTCPGYGAIPCCSHAEKVDPQNDLCRPPSSQSTSSANALLPEEDSPLEVEFSIAKSFASPQSTEALPLFRCLMIVVALSFHSLFEG